jgi:hypothetical protein
MIYSWLRILCLVGLCTVSSSGYAQETTSYSRPQMPISDPVYVLNSTVIINGLLAEFTPQEIKGITVYKGPASPGTETVAPQLRNLSSAGVLDIKSAKRVKSQSFAQVGRRLGLRGPLTFAVNGHPLDPQAVAALRVAPAAIGQLHILRPTPEAPETRVDIWLVPAPKPDTSNYPPGTIFLR